MTLLGAIIAAPLLWLVVWGCSKGAKHLHRFTIRHLLVVTTVVAIAISLLIQTKAIQSWTDLRTLVMAVLFWIAVAAPTLNFITYLRVGIIAWAFESDASFQKHRTGVVGVWIASWFYSWKVAVDIMLIEYSKLPTTNPNCYVSSAAANGHRRLVGTETSGAGVVNRQMQHLKFIEFAVAAAFPKTHRRVRDLYDQVGPVLAGVCGKNVWFADVTYLALKPIEYLACLVQLSAGVPSNTIRSIYRSKASRCDPPSHQH